MFWLWNSSDFGMDLEESRVTRYPLSILVCFYLGEGPQMVAREELMGARPGI